MNDMKKDFEKQVRELFKAREGLSLGTMGKHDGSVYVFWNNTTVVGEVSGSSVCWYGRALKEAMKQGMEGKQ